MCEYDRQRLTLNILLLCIIMAKYLLTKITKVGAFFNLIVIKLLREPNHLL